LYLWPLAAPPSAALQHEHHGNHGNHGNHEHRRVAAVQLKAFSKWGA